ncbi:hypothetical protein RHGRI_002984 [Rhododendron griersonianum]|uniref:Uncharacterized protein n=1 Tax=Rhododendron griersonianum TaxID=479676 RepID=A0AAV6LRL8_9ERIC|nr:hypothetical protein RHGRI_002984 [Rhododendron griersonianum]
MADDDDIIAKLEETTKDAARHQLETLRAILERNAGVGYLHPHLRSCPAPVDASTFRRAVPLSCYDNYADHISRLADGGALDDDHGQRYLSVDPLVCFFYRFLERLLCAVSQFRDKFHEAKIDPLL